MNRRGFLSLIGGAATSLLIPERTFFLPPRGGWHQRPIDAELYACVQMKIAELKRDMEIMILANSAGRPLPSFNHLAQGFAAIGANLRVPEGVAQLASGVSPSVLKHKSYELFETREPGGTEIENKLNHGVLPYRIQFGEPYVFVGSESRIRNIVVE